MLKRMSLVFTLLMALVGIIGVQAQAVAEPQSMAQYVPADSEVFFAIRTDGAFLDELSGIINGVVTKLPPIISAQAQNLDLKTLLEAQVGSLAETGVGDYVAVSMSNTVVLYDQDNTNDDDIVFYVVVDLNDRAKFEALFEKSVPNAQKTAENGATVYSGPEGSSDQGRLIVQDNLAYLTNTTAVPSGNMLSSDGLFANTIASLPEPSYNFLVYADFGPLFEALMTQMPAQSTEMFDMMGVDFTQMGPVAMGGTILDGKALVIDSYSPSFTAMMPMTGMVDPEFATNIPAGFSFMVHGTDIKTSANAGLDFIYKANEAQGGSNPIPSREELNSQLKTFLGIDIDNDILGWMTGDYALVADLDMMAALDAMDSGNLTDITLAPRFAFIVEGDASEKPAKVAQVIGNLLVAQTKDIPDAPKITLTTEDSLTTVIIEDVPLSQNPEILVDIEIAGNGDVFVVGDQETVEAILSGEGDRLTGDASFVDAQKYILPNASNIAYAGGEGWGDLITLGGTLAAVSSISTSNEDDVKAQMQMMASVFRSGYDIINSSSISVSYNADGSQLSRVVLTLK